MMNNRGAAGSSPRAIPKADGQQRPLAIAALEDKIVQKAACAVLNAIYEEDFKPWPNVARAVSLSRLPPHTRSSSH